MDHAALEVSSCMVYPRFLLVSEDSCKNVCGRFTQVEELFHLMAELQEEVDGFEEHLGVQRR